MQALITTGLHSLRDRIANQFYNFFCRSKILGFANDSSASLGSAPSAQTTPHCEPARTVKYHSPERQPVWGLRAKYETQLEHSSQIGALRL